MWNNARLRGEVHRARERERDRGWQIAAYLLCKAFLVRIDNADTWTCIVARVFVYNYEWIFRGDARVSCFLSKWHCY